VAPGGPGPGPSALEPMPTKIVLILLAVVAIAAIALGVSKAYRRRDPDRRALAGERLLAWLGDRIDESIGMWALRRLLGRADDADGDPAGEPSRTERASISRESGRMRSPALAPRGQIGDRSGWDGLPHAHRPVDPRGRLSRDATIVLLVFAIGAAVVVGLQPTGLLGGVGGVTATPERSLPLQAIGGDAEPADGRGPAPTAASPAAKPTPSRTPGPAHSSTPGAQATASAQPTPRATPKPTPRPTRSPTPTSTTRPTVPPTAGPTATPTPAAPIAVITVSVLAACTAQAPASYTFSGATSLEAVSYSWTFSGGIAGSTAATVTRDFPGSTTGTTYTITLTVENGAGAADTDSTEITVICP
jgi:PKD domain